MQWCDQDMQRDVPATQQSIAIQGDNAGAGAAAGSRNPGSVDMKPPGDDDASFAERMRSQAEAKRMRMDDKTDFKVALQQ